MAGQTSLWQSHKQIWYSEGPDLCNCCTVPKRESMQHVFLHGEATQYVWKHFGGPLGIRIQTNTIRHMIYNWLNQKSNNSIHKLVLQTIPALICWEIWKQRRECNYGGKRNFNRYMMIQQLAGTFRVQLLKLIQKLVWHYLGSLFVKNLWNLSQTFLVCWKFPENGVLKLNTDGNYCPASGKSGMGEFWGMIEAISSWLSSHLRVVSAAQKQKLRLPVLD